MIVEPRSTYRVQLRPEFGFAEARSILDHLARLETSHLYTSPVLEAVTGSTHGYDVTDPSRVRAELGGDDALDALVAALRDHGMGWIVDIVPNHQSVAVPRENPRWWDVLRHGREAASAAWFDIDWDAADGRVVLPVLGAPLDSEIDAGAFHVTSDGDELVLDVHGLVLPLAPGSATADDVGAGPDRIRSILDRQHHRPSYWRAGDRNYRVFFDIDDLAAVRVEDDAVFDDVHSRLADWVADDLVDGVRVDHVDGLADPAAYLRRLRDLIGPDRGLWVEKILLPDEELPEGWPVEGSTGYDFARLATAVSVDPAAQDRFDRRWQATGGAGDYHDLERAAKRAALHGRLGPDLRRVVDAAEQAIDGQERDVLHQALVELAVAFPVYRSYGVGDDRLDEVDRTRLDGAARSASRHLPELAGGVGAVAAELDAPTGRAGVELRTRFQQLTGPAMAKGAEDTAFYRYHRLVALSEVGGDPSSFGTTPQALHDHNRAIAARWPATMLAASTHDTKRSADVRARLAVLSQRPDAWEAAADEWRQLAAPLHTDRLDGPTESLLWQTLVGAWPLTSDRLVAYLEKAMRESGEHTEWTAIDEEYEAAVTGFARSVLDAPELVARIEDFFGSIGDVGRATRLAEVVLRLTSPGVPDTYQGDQDHDLSLVDPDNRRPVDHRAIDQRLSEGIAVGDVDRLGLGPDAPTKLWVTHRLLTLRSRRPDDLGPGGGYEPLAVAGDADDRVVAYRRGGVIALVDARPGLEPVGDDVTVSLPAGRWTDVLRADAAHDGGADVTLRAIWGSVPAAVLVAD